MKTAIITGAGSGIGAATAALFSVQGYATVLVGRNRANLEKTASGLRHVTIEPCDLQNSKAVEALGKKLVQEHDVEVLVNNAGIIDRSPFNDITEKSLREQFEVNFFAPMLLTKQILTKLYHKKEGSIVNVASSLGVRPIAQTSAYSSSKAAMINWTQSLALEAAQYNVRVNVVCPGIVETPILTGHTRELTLEDKNNYGKLHPLGRMGRPEEIAQAIWYLATANWATGSVLIVDGGISLT